MLWIYPPAPKADEQSDLEAPETAQPELSGIQRGGVVWFFSPTIKMCRGVTVWVNETDH